MIVPPHSKIGVIDSAKITALVEESPLLYKYKDPIDRESAYEILTKQFTEQAEAATRQAEEKQLAKENAAKAKEEAALSKKCCAVEQLYRDGQMYQAVKKPSDAFAPIVRLP